MKKVLLILVLFLSDGALCGCHSQSHSKASEKSSALIVIGRNFAIPATQQIQFVSLKIYESNVFDDKTLPRVIDLRNLQSSVKSQGQRGACTYFVIASLIESLIKKASNREFDVSEEYIAWAAKVKKGMRLFEEDSSVAVNAATIQEFGFMLEDDLPYQPSWFDVGFPCEGQKKHSKIDPICFSHRGPSEKASRRIIDGKNFVFEAVGSSSFDLVRTLARLHTPVTASILGHRLMWPRSVQTGELTLTPEMKEDCQKTPKNCDGHVVLVVGYDLNKRIFTFKNSWGKDWGANGYGTIPFDYIDQMSDRKFLTGNLNGNIEIPNGR